MKRIFALALVIILCLSIVACKNKDDKDPAATTTQSATTTEATTEATTKSTSGSASTKATTATTSDYDPSDPSVDDIF